MNGQCKQCGGKELCTLYPNRLVWESSGAPALLNGKSDAGRRAGGNAIMWSVGALHFTLYENGSVSGVRQNVYNKQNESF